MYAKRALDYAMVGGLLVSQALTLFTTPVVYLYLDQFSSWLADWGRSAHSGRQRPPVEPRAIEQAAE